MPLDIWLRTYHPVTYREIHRHFQSNPGSRFPGDGTDWFALLPEDLRQKVKRLVDDSPLDADHGIPVALLVKIRNQLSSKQRELVRSKFTFELCRGCNRDRSDHLDPLPTLLKRWSRTSRFEGRGMDAVECDPELKDIVALYGLAEAAAKAAG
jgi:hypothetical protein